jgi:TatD DNase family protein
MSSKLGLIDSHAHIYYKDYSGDFDEMLQRADEAGVAAIIVVGTDIESSRQSVELAERYRQIYAAVGIHPHDASRVTEKCYQVIREMAVSSEKVIAVGEIGLDFYRDRSPREEQEIVFRRFLQLAAEIDKSVIIHDRDAHQRILAILREEKKCKGVLHCFSGDAEMAKEVVDMGYYISIPGTITYQNNETQRQVVRATTIDRLLLETDCPYLSPVPHRGKRNEPAYVTYAAEQVAVLKGLAVEDVARITTKNVCDLFGISLWDQSARIAYRIRNSLYLNITNRCSNRCTFCAKFDDFTVKGHNLLLEREPTCEEVLSAVGEHHGQFDEIVFCGFGESLLRLELVKQLSAEFKKSGFRVRINTDGQANIVHGRDVLPELEGLIDSISVSLNAPDPLTYSKLCNTPFGAEGFTAVCDFISRAVRHIPQVTATAVTVPGVDITACERLAMELGAGFRAREYSEVG